MFKKRKTCWFFFKKKLFAHVSMHCSLDFCLPLLDRCSFSFLSSHKVLDDLLFCLVGSIKDFIFMIVFFDSHCSWYLMTDSFLLFLWFEGFRYNIWACMALHCRHKLWFLCHSLIGRFLVLLRWQGLHSSLQNCRPATCSAAMRPGICLLKQV